MSPEARRLRTASLNRRVLLVALTVLALVLTITGVLTEVLVGAQLRADAASRLGSHVQAAEQAARAGAGPREVAAAAQGDGVTASLLTPAGVVLGNSGLGPSRRGTERARPGGPQPLAGPGAAGGEGGSAQPQVLTRSLPDGSVLTVSVDTASISQVQQQLRGVLVPLLLGAVVVAGLLLAVGVRTALRPLGRMTTLARDIAHGDRGRRLAPVRTDTELGRTAAAFDDMLDSLEGAVAAAEAADARTRRFVADAAHELRTPLAGVQAATEAMLGAGTTIDSGRREHLQLLAVRQAQRAGHLVQELLAMARIDEGLTLTQTPVELAAFTDTQVAQARALAPGMTIAVDAAACVVTADPPRLAQVLTNVLDNARNHAGPNAEVQISVHATPTAAQLLVTDNGPGVPVAERERIFDRLVRLDEARSYEGGSQRSGAGLGLAIARGIARAHGGELTWARTRSGLPAAATPGARRRVSGAGSAAVACPAPAQSSPASTAARGWWRLPGRRLRTSTAGRSGSRPHACGAPGWS